MSRQWMRLDNAALIFPATKRPTWVNAFRVSMTLKEDIDPELLQKAVDELKPRFPSYYVRLGTGAFWYFLEETREGPYVHEDYSYPLTHMSAAELKTCCIRVLYYKKRIAVEYFHSLTDGSGGMIYLKTLVARYLSIKYSVEIPATDGVLDYTENPRPEELEDSFLTNSGKYALRTNDVKSYRLHGTSEPTAFLNLITGVVDTDILARVAKEHNSTITVFLAAVMAQSVLEIQNEDLPLSRQKRVNITIPVNLRKIFGSETLRNFALVVNPGIDPKLGEYTLDEICKEIKNQMAVEITPQKMRAQIAANVNPQKMAVLRVAPLFVKNIVMRAVYASVGESRGCLNISNLGKVNLPEIMQEYVERVEFVIGVQYTYPNNCSVATCGNVTCINMIRNIQEAELERKFFSKLVELGVPVSIESNNKE